MSDGRHDRSPNHPSLRGSASESSPDATGEISWPLVERRRQRSTPPTGIERRASLDTRRARWSRFMTRRPDPRIDTLVRANDLLLELRKVSLLIPQEFDSDVVLDRGLAETVALLPGAIVTVLMKVDDDRFVTVRGRGSHDRVTFVTESLPSSAVEALGLTRSSRRRLKADGFATEADEGVYCALRARGRVIGLLAVEVRQGWPIDDAVTEAITGIADAVALGVDNARMLTEMRRSTEDIARRRVARDLHDRTGSTLAAIGFELDRLALRARPDLTDDLTRIRHELSAVVSDLRESLADLRSGEMTPGDFATDVSNFVDRVGRRSGLITHIDLDTSIELPATIAREFMIIAKEAVINTERHARATALSVVLRRDENEIVLDISDNGRGFDANRIGPDSYGIAGMRERAEAIGARLGIDSGRGGTTIRLGLERNR